MEGGDLLPCADSNVRINSCGFHGGELVLNGPSDSFLVSLSSVILITLELPYNFKFF